MRFDRAIRSTIWRLRYVDRLVTLKDLRKTQQKSLLASHKAITDMLNEIQKDEEISQLVVFDVFDLPPVLAFGETHSIPVSVR
jgi:ribosomal protein L30/L7E